MTDATDRHDERHDPDDYFTMLRKSIGKKSMMDERHRLACYRAGFYAFCSMTGAAYLWWLCSGLLLDEDAFTLTLDQFDTIAFWFAIGGVGVFSLFTRNVDREIGAASRIHWFRHPRSKRQLLIVIVALATAAAGFLFWLSYYADGWPLWKALVLSITVPVMSVFFSSRMFLRRPSKQELDEAEQ